MKKPKIIKKTVVSKNSDILENGFESIGGILNMLGSNQILTLANSLTTLSNAGIEYASKREDTKQTAIHGQVEIEKIKSEQAIAKFQQIVSLASSGTTLVCTGIEYAKEREKTKQINTFSQVEVTKANERREKALFEHEQTMTQMTQQRKDNKNQSKKDIKVIENTSLEIENKNEQIHRILDSLESGKISEAMLLHIIRELKQ